MNEHDAALEAAGIDPATVYKTRRTGEKADRPIRVTFNSGMEVYIADAPEAAPEPAPAPKSAKKPAAKKSSTPDTGDAGNDDADV